MAKRLRNIIIQGPGYLGLNTEDTVVDLDHRFATTADNCIIDKFGRLGARKGFDTITTDRSELGAAANTIDSLGIFRDQSGNTVTFSAGNNKILSGTTTLVDETPAAYTITANNWKMVNFNDEFYFFQRAHEPLSYDNVTSTVSGMGSSIPKGNEALASFGRMWVADIADNTSTVYWSDLLTPSDFTGGSSGSIDVMTVWPNGYDEITALGAYNNFLVIFGRNSMIIYSGADDPSTMAVSDAIEGIGCIARDSVVVAGDDLIFLSSTGVRSLKRTVLQNSLPTSDLSRNVRSDLFELIDANTTEGDIQAEYSQENAFYLLHFRASDITYCFDMRQQLPDGSRRITRWVSSPFRTIHRDPDSGVIYAGNSYGIGTYSGFNDPDGATYTYRYFSPILRFGRDDTQGTLKFLKKIRATMQGGSNSMATIRWGYGFTGVYNSATVALTTGTPAEYGIAEYNVDEYSGGEYLSSQDVHTTGNGADVTVGVEVEIDGSTFSLQEIFIQTLIGKLV